MVPVLNPSDPPRGEPSKVCVSACPKTGGDVSEGDTSEHPLELLEDLVASVLATVGFELCHLDWSSAGKYRSIRVYVDHPDGIGLDACAHLSPILGNALDATEGEAGQEAVARMLAAPYLLEVSSPGLDRPLSRRHHFERFIGHRAAIKTRFPLHETENQKAFHGRIRATHPDPKYAGDTRRGSVELVDDAGQLYQIPLLLIRRANLVFEG